MQLIVKWCCTVPPSPLNNFVVKSGYGTIWLQKAVSWGKIVNPGICISFGCSKAALYACNANFSWVQSFWFGLTTNWLSRSTHGDMPRLEQVLRGIKSQHAKQGHTSRPHLPITPPILTEMKEVNYWNETQFYFDLGSLHPMFLWFSLKRRNHSPLR